VKRWTVADSSELYCVENWSNGFFEVGPNGNLLLNARRNPSDDGAEVACPPVDLKQLIDELVERGIDTPILLRFRDIVRQRLADLAGAFSRAMAEAEYGGKYRGVYPIKVNQQRHLVEDLVDFARDHHIGLEAGSKPELLITLAMLDDPDALIVCNGYKDRSYIETALLSRKLGRDTLIVIEKPSEVKRVLEVSADLGIEPVIGVRAKLSRPGRGRWKTSSGDRAKFGLTALQIANVVEELRAAGKLDCLKLLHFHIGSQVTGIRTFKTALREACRLYVELCKMGAPMGKLDVGGGLGVDYDGSRTDFESSMNYTEAEYANDVVWAIHAACEAEDLPHPDIISESGRAMVAHHSMLVFDVTGVEQRPTSGRPEGPVEDEGSVIGRMVELFDTVTARNVHAVWHEAVDVREEGRYAFDLGLISLPEYAQLERAFWQVCGRIEKEAERLDHVPEDLEKLWPMLADTYYCNFSLFQSLPDAWAIGQLFPILPLQRLDEEPTRRAILADLTCDSDGKIDRFIDLRDVRRALEVHPLKDGEPYYLAIMMVGAYQEILGDLHNLLGDTHTAHISQQPDGYSVDVVVEGDRVDDVLKYVQYDGKQLLNRVRKASERALREGRITRNEARTLLAAYQAGLDSYTYLGD
jgi:arginine decarboxylase